LGRIAAGECVIDPAVVRELLERQRRHDPLAELSTREREIVALMAEGRSNQGICECLWLSDYLNLPQPPGGDGGAGTKEGRRRVG
jgi:DNA-binding NarL/FixJ family response regulator